MDAPKDDYLPFTILVSESAAEPILMFDQHAALRIAVVERACVQLLSDAWDIPGVYILLDSLAVEGSWGCYVGKAPSGLRTRLQNHVRNKEHWRRAMLVCRDTTHGFNSAQIGWLEGRLYDLLDAAEDARLHNGVRPKDETLPSWERGSLESCVAPVSRVLRLLGFDPASPDDSSAVPIKKSSRFYGIAMSDLVDAGLADTGEQLVSTNGAWPASASLLSDGQLEVNGRVYATPSAAAAAIKNGAVNGWAFWAVERPSGRVPLAVLRARYIDARASVPGKASPDRLNATEPT